MIITPEFREVLDRLEAAIEDVVRHLLEAWAKMRETITDPVSTCARDGAVHR